MQESSIQRASDLIDAGPVIPPPELPALGQTPVLGQPPVFGPPPPPSEPRTGRARPIRRRDLPAITGAAFFGSLAAAFCINLGLQGRLNSTATLLATMIVMALILAEPARRRAVVVGPAVLAVMAAAVLVLRSSPWVTVPAFMAVLGSLLVASQSQLLAGSSMARAVPNFAADVLSAVGWVLKPVSKLMRVSSGNDPVIRGLVLAGVVVVPMLVLLASADAVFNQLLAAVAEDRFWTHVVITAVVLPATAALALAAKRTDRPTDPPVNKDQQQQDSQVSMVEGTMVLTSVAVVLGAWGLTQVLVALGGADRLLETANLTAAQNARRGYFQLMAVTALVVAVLIAVDRFVERATGSQRTRFMLLTTLIGIETIGVVGASYSRLALYVQGFGHTMLRTSVAWFLGWLAVMLVVVIVSMNRRSPNPQATRLPLTGWLYILAALWVVAFGAFNPEGFVAGRNLGRQATIGLDSRYLSEQLGPDAIPTIVDRIPDQDPATQQQLRSALCQQLESYRYSSITDWNLSHTQAETSIESLNCP